MSPERAAMAAAGLGYAVVTVLHLGG